MAVMNTWDACFSLAASRRRLSTSSSEAKSSIKKYSRGCYVDSNRALGPVAWHRPATSADPWTKYPARAPFALSRTSAFCGPTPVYPSERSVRTPPPAMHRGCLFPASIESKTDIELRQKSAVISHDQGRNGLTITGAKLPPARHPVAPAPDPRTPVDDTGCSGRSKALRCFSSRRTRPRGKKVGS